MARGAKFFTLPFSVHESFSRKYETRTVLDLGLKILMLNEFEL